MNSGVVQAECGQKGKARGGKSEVGVTLSVQVSRFLALDRAVYRKKVNLSLCTP
jgi:hypothetical protein